MNDYDDEVHKNTQSPAGFGATIVLLLVSGAFTIWLIAKVIFPILRSIF